VVLFGFGFLGRSFIGGIRTIQKGGTPPKLLPKERKWNASHCRQRDWQSTQMQGWEDYFQLRLFVVAD
jgi:hypothetical protein